VPDPQPSQDPREEGVVPAPETNTFPSVFTASLPQAGQSAGSPDRENGRRISKE